ncbi:MAG: MarR family transcriptional regulator [Bacteroidota bacterium]
MSKEKVLEAMKKAAKPLKAGEIAELSGIDKKDVEKIMNQLKEENLIVSPKRCFWEPK